MNIFHLIPSFLQRMIRQFFTFIIIIISIAIALIQTNIAYNKSLAKPVYGIVNNDKGKVSKKVLDALKQKDNAELVITDFEKGMDKLNNHEYSLLLVFNDDFSEKILRGNYKKTIQIYAYATTFTNTSFENDLIYQVMKNWALEFFMLESIRAFKKHDVDLTEDEIQSLREDLQEVIKKDKLVNIKLNYINDKTLLIRDANKINTLHALNWYLTFSTFYLFVSGVWFIDIQNHSLRLTLKQKRISEWKVYSSISAAIVIICTIGLIFTGCLASFFFSEPITIFLSYLHYYVLYYFAMTGVMIFVTAFFNYPAALLIIAPIFSFINAVLCGLLYDLPKWAYNINKVAHILPGAWLSDIITGKTETILYLFMISLLYFVIGILVTKIVRRKNVKGI